MPIITQFDAKVYAALRDRLETMSGGYYISEPGETYHSTDDETYLLVQDVRLEPDRVYTNTTAPDWHRGELNVAVITPYDWTHNQRLGVLGLIRAHFPKDHRMTSADVTVKIRETPFAVSAYRDDVIGKMRLPVSIRWWAWG